MKRPALRAPHQGPRLTGKAAGPVSRFPRPNASRRLSRVTRGLAEPQQSLQHLDLGFRQSLLINALEKGMAIVLKQFTVKLPLGPIHLAIDRLFGLGGKLARYLLLCPPENEWAQCTRQEMLRFTRNSARSARTKNSRSACLESTVILAEKRWLTSF